MKIKAAIALSLSLLATPALAQSTPGLVKDQVPTAAQWNSYFAKKQDVLGFTPIGTSGGAFTGRVTFAASNSTRAGITIPQGSAPTAPLNGDLWTTSAGVYARINGATQGPFASIGITDITINGVSCLLGGSCTISSTAASITVGTTTIAGGTPSGLLFNNAGTLGNLATANSGVLVTSGGGVPSISTTLPAGLSAATMSLASPTIATPSVTFANGAASTIAASSANTGFANALSVANGGTVSNAATVASISASLSAGSSVNLIGSVTGGGSPTASIASGSGATGGLAVSSSAGPLKLQGLTVTASTGTLTIANAKTLVASNSLTLAGTDGMTLTFQGTDTYVGRATTDTLTNKTLNSPVLTGTPTGAAASTTVNGQVCALNGTCTISASAGTISVGVTSVALGSSGNVLYNNGGVLGELITTGSGNLVLSNNPTITLGSATGLSLTTGVTGLLPLTNGGCNASLTASNGGIVWTNATQCQILAGTATAGQMLRSGASATPAWSTATWPATTAAGTLLVSATANAVTASSSPVLGVAGTTVGSIGFQNATSGTVTLQPATGALGTVAITIPAAAGTMAVSATAPITLSAAGAIGITGAVLTKTDDTNVTLTLGGTPASALVTSASITVGWTGQLSVARGGTGLSSGTSGGLLYYSAAGTIASSAAYTSGAILTGGGAGAAPGTLSCATTTTVLHGGSPPSCSQVVYGDIATAEIATTLQYAAGTPSKLVQAGTIYPSEVTITYGATTVIDMSTLINGSVTLTGNITTLTINNVIAGKGGAIRLVQDATGSRTWPAGGNTVLKYAGGLLPSLSTAANAVDVLTYYCSTTTFCTASLALNVKNP